ATTEDTQAIDGVDTPAPPVEVLDDVRVTGAAPAWSPDGQLLAFSAMPTDRSRGPDLYVWRSGESRARRLTDDHHSWFASWSGARIVASRTLQRSDGVTARTIVIDPANGRERAVSLDGAWLPVIAPGGGFALSWRGVLAGTAQQPRPRSGSM